MSSRSTPKPYQELFGIFDKLSVSMQSYVAFPFPGCEPCRPKVGKTIDAVAEVKCAVAPSIYPKVDGVFEG